MRYTRQVTISLFPSTFLVVLVAVITVLSCKVPKKYQKDKPFVFKTSIEVQGNLKLSERQDLELRLLNQLDDSLKVRLVSLAGIRKTLVKPAVFDTLYANRSVLFMNALMNSMGYYQAQIKWDSTLKRVGQQQRVLIDFTVLPGKKLKMDSIGYALTDSALQQLAIRNKRATLLLKNQPYSQQVISAELDRLITLYKDNGYFKISKEDLYAEVDTVLAGLINPGLDLFEQIRLLNELQRKRENPTIDVIIRQRTKEGSANLKKYAIRNVSIYPEVRLFEDSSKRAFDSVRVNGIKVFLKENLFRPSFLARNSALIPGAEYKEADYYKTINTFSQLGAWQQVNIDMLPIDSLGLLDVVIYLYPAKKQSLVIDLEATRNSGDVIATSNLFGIGLNVGLRNRNLARQSIQSISSIRGGIELGTQTRLIQTQQGSFDQKIFFPKFILPFKLRKEEKLTSSRTILNFNMSYTDRRDFFTLGSINGSIGYEWTRKKEVATPRRNHVWLYVPFNIELVRLGRRDSLNKLFEKIPRLESSFNNGLIISQKLIYQLFLANNNKLSSLKIGFEESGGFSGIIKYVDREGGLYRYVKADADFSHLISFERSAWAFRMYAGIGIPYGQKLDTSSVTGISRESSLPFFKSFFAGGPNSMRAWQVRKLGIGSSNLFDTLKNGGYDRFADIKLEGNIEFRFNVATIAGIKLKSALFSDIGNIWYRKTDLSPEQKGSEFNIGRLYKDLAVAGGTSLRLDFNYFLVRFDWAYRLKDPVYADINNGWFYNLKLQSGQFQLGINYPF
ncbi:MAG: BamA/TamA family outer membrane protein [Chitinophagaceae bacterium]